MYCAAWARICSRSHFYAGPAALVPPARQNQVRYHGLMAAQAHDRDRLLALMPNADGDPGADDAGTDGPGAELASADAAEPRSCACYRMRWAQLLARVFNRRTDCSMHCGGDRSPFGSRIRSIRVWRGDRAGQATLAVGRGTGLVSIGSRPSGFAAGALDQLGAR